MPNAYVPDVVGFASTYRSGTDIAAHSHAAHQLVHAISGAMRVVAEKRVWILPLGRAIWIPAGVMHAIRCNGDVAMRTAYLSSACTGVPHRLAVLSVSALARELLVRIAVSPDDVLKRQFTDILIQEIAQGEIAPFSLPLPDDQRLVHLVQAFTDDPACRISAADWAKKLGYSDRTFIRSLRRETGMTFRELRRQTRITAAVEKLAQGQSVTSVAYDVGFETPSAFVAAFRTVTGDTPHQFKTKARPL